MTIKTNWQVGSLVEIDLLVKPTCKSLFLVNKYQLSNLTQTLPDTVPDLPQSSSGAKF